MKIKDWLKIKSESQKLEKILSEIESLKSFKYLSKSKKASLIDYCFNQYTYLFD